ncbi:T9SS type A sorting domain-containing protein [bacterium]|nr:T9SS type A sorting domain-containing protein [bacterium]
MAIKVYALLAIIGLLALCVPKYSFSVTITQLTDDGGKDPVWSRDGTDRIVYHTDYHVLVITPLGGEPYEITSYYSGILLWGPSWSPDGGRVAFYTLKDGSGIVVSGGGAASDSTAMIVGAGPAQSRPCWSPVADVLGFDMYSSGSQEIFVCPVQVGGISEREQIVSSPGSSRLSWSPDGTQIVFERDSKLYVAQTDGSDSPRLLLEIKDHSLLYPDWSPDGQLVAYTEVWGRSPNTHYILKVIPVMGGTPTVIIPDTSTKIRGPTWSENGQHLAYFNDTGIMLVENLPPLSDVPDAGANPVVLSHVCYPNPFNAATDIKFEIAATCHVTVDIFSLSGRLIARLQDRVRSAGPHTVSWMGDGAGGQPIPSGTYFYRIVAGENAVTGRITLVK